MAFGESVPVKLVGIYDDQVAGVYIEGYNGTVGVNLWDVKGYAREFDGLSTEKYVPVEEFDSFETPADLNFPIGTYFAAKNVGGKSYGGFFLDEGHVLKAAMGIVTTRQEIDLETVRHIVTPHEDGRPRKELFERLYESLDAGLPKPAVKTLKFEQKLEIEALPVLNASIEDIHDFLSGTGQKFTANTNQTTIVGIIHQENLEPNCYGRRFVSRHQYIVKVNGKLTNVLNLDGLKAQYGYEA